MYKRQTLDRDERKMSLGIKQLKSDPWQNIEEKYGVGTKHTATVRNFTNFGVFVEIEEGVDGLIHISDPVSYTHLDVYKRQDLTLVDSLGHVLPMGSEFDYFGEEARPDRELSLIHI